MTAHKPGDIHLYRRVFWDGSAKWQVRVHRRDAVTGEAWLTVFRTFEALPEAFESMRFWHENRRS